MDETDLLHKSGHRESLILLKDVKRPSVRCPRTPSARSPGIYLHVDPQGRRNWPPGLYCWRVKWNVLTMNHRPAVGWFVRCESGIIYFYRV